MRGYSASRFSFNTPSMKSAKAKKMGGGRCPACEGQGIILAEMPFLPDVIAPCQACGGSRFDPSTLEVRFAGLSIGDVPHLPAADAAQIFANRRIHRPLATLANLGVGYVQIGPKRATREGASSSRASRASSRVRAPRRVRCSPAKR
jgi:excinuclease ABC subunit A